MSRQRTAALITLGSSGAVSYQRLPHDDVYALVRDNEPELTQLLAEGRFDAGMFASDHHPLLDVREQRSREAQQWLASAPVRRSKRSRKRSR